MMKCPCCGFETPEAEQFCSHCGTSFILTTDAPKIPGVPALPSGTTLNHKYHIKSLLRSGLTNVYQANCEDEQELLLVEEVAVAHKKKSDVIARIISTFKHTDHPSSPNDTTNEKTAEAAFQQSLPLRQKFELLSSLGSLDLQKAYDSFTLGDREYLVLESPKGKSLIGFVSQNLPDEDLAVDIAIKLCQAVSQVHRAGYVHLNIEPGSIYISDGHVSLFNFDRAMRIGEQGHDYLTSEGYSAPELLSRDAVADVRADIYSIGAVLFWMISGQNIPLSGVAFTKILSSVSSLELARILLSCLAHDPDLRFRNVEELKQKLTVCQMARRKNLHFDTACLTDTGMERKNNEDSCYILESTRSIDSGTESYGVYLLADGMGGERAGEVASAKAVEEISSAILDSLRASSKPVSFSEVVKQAIEKANSEIYNMARNRPELSSMGTTVTLGLRVNNELYLGHVGDSRAYLIREGTIRQLTQDHSVVAGLLKAGMITQEEAKQHPDRGKIFRCLGSSPNIVIDTYKDIGNEEKLTLLHGDSLVLCTDGLTTHVDDNEILAEVVKPCDAYSVCRQLIWLANQRGGTDNISVIVAKAIDIKHQGDANV